MLGYLLGDGGASPTHTLHSKKEVPCGPILQSP